MLSFWLSNEDTLFIESDFLRSEVRQRKNARELCRLKVGQSVNFSGSLCKGLFEFFIMFGLKYRSQQIGINVERDDQVHVFQHDSKTNMIKNFAESSNYIITL